MRRHWPVIILAIIFVTISFLWTKFQWDECRKESDSVWFCLQHVG